MLLWDIINIVFCHEIAAAVLLKKNSQHCKQINDKCTPNMKGKCHENCTRVIYKHVFKHKPILWLDTKYVSIDPV